MYNPARIHNLKADNIGERVYVSVNLTKATYASGVNVFKANVPFAQTHDKPEEAIGIFTIDGLMAIKDRFMSDIERLTPAFDNAHIKITIYAHEHDHFEEDDSGHFVYFYAIMRPISDMSDRAVINKNYPTDQARRSAIMNHLVNKINQFANQWINKGTQSNDIYKMLDKVAFKVELYLPEKGFYQTPIIGAGRKAIDLSNPSDIRHYYCHKINNDDNLCLARSIAVAETKRVHNLLVERNLIDGDVKNAISDENYQTELAINIHEACDIPTNDDSYECDFADIEKISHQLRMNIKVIQIEQGNPCITKTQSNYEDAIYLFLRDRHYEPMIKDKIGRILGCFRVCFICDARFNNTKQFQAHADKCVPKPLAPLKRCHGCNRDNCQSLQQIDILEKQQCAKCGIDLYSDDCRNHHKCSGDRNKDPKKCDNCGLNYITIFGKVTNHICYHGICKLCNEVHSLAANQANSCCRMTPKPPKPPVKQFVAYDFETSPNDYSIHVVRAACATRFTIDPVTNEVAILETIEVVPANGKISATIIDTIEDFEQHEESSNELFIYTSPNTAINPTIIRGENVMESFCQWALKSEHAGTTFIAHNARSFDFHFISAYALKHPERYNIHTVDNGNKTMMATIEIATNKHNRLEFSGKITFLDSLNHVQESLAGMGKMFNLDTLKGYHPHNINMIYNWSLVLPDGEFPPFERFSVEHLSAEDLIKIKNWHLEQKADYTKHNKSYSFSRELMKYCMDDVMLLKSGIVAYHILINDTVRKITDNKVDFHAWNSPTKANLSISVLRLPELFSEGKIYADDNGRLAYDKYLLNCVRYNRYFREQEEFEWVAYERHPNLKCYENSAPTIEPGRVFKYRMQNNIRIKEYAILLSCAFHGCLLCNKDKQDYRRTYNGMSIGALFQHVRWMVDPKQNDDNLVNFRYECEAKQMLEHPCNKITELIDPIITRDNTLNGGHTDAFSLLSESIKKTQIIDKDAGAPMSETEQIEAIVAKDVCSLYPTTMVYDAFPVGQPMRFNQMVKKLATPINYWTPELITRMVVNPIKKIEAKEFFVRVYQGTNPIDFVAKNDINWVNLDTIVYDRKENKPVYDKITLPCFYDFIQDRYPATECRQSYRDEHGPNDTFIFRDELATKQFIYFQCSFIDVVAIFTSYIEYCERIHKHSPSLHEYLTENTIQKLRFDLDYEEVIDYDTFDEIYLKIQQACRVIIAKKFSEEDLEKFDSCFDDLVQFYDAYGISDIWQAFESPRHGAKAKSSFHIIAPIYGLYTDLREFANDVYSLLKNEHEISFDGNVHKSCQSFRAPFCAKQSEPTRKKSPYKIRRQNTANMFLQINGEDVVNDEYMININKNKITRTQIQKQESLDFPSELHDILRKNINDFDNVWEFRRLYGNQYQFLRKKMSYCELCNRNHSSDNTLQVIVSDKANRNVYLRCAKNADQKAYRKLGELLQDSDNKLTPIVEQGDPNVSAEQKHFLNVEIPRRLHERLKESITDFDEIFTLRFNKGFNFYYSRKIASMCGICKEIHEKEHSLKVTIGRSCKFSVFTRCSYNNKYDSFNRLGNLLTPQEIKELAKDSNANRIFKPRKYELEEPPKAYNMFDALTGKLHLIGDKDELLYLTTKFRDQFINVKLKLTAKEAEFYKRFYLHDWNPSESLFIVRADLIPPRDLLRPVIPTKGDKLLYTLEPNKASVCHPELKIALEKGYKIDKIYDIMFWPQSSKDLFKKYMLGMMQIKEQNSDLSATLYTDGKVDIEKLDAHIERVKEKYGFTLDKDYMLSIDCLGNTGLRKTAKGNMNNPFGRLCMNNNRSKTKYVSSFNAVIEIMTDPKVADIQYEILDENDYYSPIKIIYENNESDIASNNSTAWIYGAFITSHARSRLYEKMDVVGNSLKYTDTDSIYHTESTTGEMIESGTGLGEWTDQLNEKPTKTIMPFIRESLIEKVASHVDLLCHKSNEDYIIYYLMDRRRCDKDQFIERLKELKITDNAIENYLTNIDEGKCILSNLKTYITTFISSAPKSYLYQKNSAFIDFIDSFSQHGQFVVTKHNDVFIVIKWLRKENRKNIYSYLITDEVEADNIIKKSIKGLTANLFIESVKEENKTIIGIAHCMGKEFYTIDLPKTDYDMKMKGITMAANNQKNINMKSFKNMVMSKYIDHEEVELQTAPTWRFNIKANQIHVVNDFSKVCRISYDKADVFVEKMTDPMINRAPHIVTIPFGYSDTILIKKEESLYRLPAFDNRLFYKHIN